MTIDLSNSFWPAMSSKLNFQSLTRGLGLAGSNLGTDLDLHGRYR